MESDIQYWANITSIATFIVTTIASLVGIYGYFHYRNQLSRKQRRLENYLKQQKQEVSGNSGQRTLVHLVRHVGLTQDEIIQISFKSRHIERKVKTDEKGFAESLLFEYSG
jgi:hypothetical protein